MPAPIWQPINLPTSIKQAIDDEQREWRRHTGENIAAWQVLEVWQRLAGDRRAWELAEYFAQQEEGVANAV